VEQATWVAVNDYESRLLMERTGLGLEELAAQVDKALIVTRGAEGSNIHAGGECTYPASGETASGGGPDRLRRCLPGGADARPAERGWTGPRPAVIASLMGSIKVESHGTQNHSFDAESFSERFMASFGYDPGLGR
jgi:adenosine kinase